MKGYRLTKTKHPDGLSVVGAAAVGGRFNSIGTKVLYLGESTAIAMLEVRVHSPDRMPPDRLLHTIELPDNSVRTPEELGLTLPSDWGVIPAPTSAALFGDTWVKSGASLALRVPSAIAPLSYNYIVNAEHPDYAKLVVVATQRITLDARLWPPM